MNVGGGGENIALESHAGCAVDLSRQQIDF